MGEHEKKRTIDEQHIIVSQKDKAKVIRESRKEPALPQEGFAEQLAADEKGLAGEQKPAEEVEERKLVVDRKPAEALNSEGGQKLEESENFEVDGKLNDGQNSEEGQKQLVGQKTPEDQNLNEVQKPTADQDTVLRHAEIELPNKFGKRLKSKGTMSQPAEGESISQADAKHAATLEEKNFDLSVQNAKLKHENQDLLLKLENVELKHQNEDLKHQIADLKQGDAVKDVSHEEARKFPGNVLMKDDSKATKDGALTDEVRVAVDRKILNDEEENVDFEAKTTNSEEQSKNEVNSNMLDRIQAVGDKNLTDPNSPTEIDLVMETTNGNTTDKNRQAVEMVPKPSSSDEKPVIVDGDNNNNEINDGLK